MSVACRARALARALAAAAAVLWLGPAPAVWSEAPAGAVAASSAPRAVVHSFAAGGVERSFRLYVGKSLPPQRPVPLVVVLHGARGHSEQVERYLGFNAVADREGLAVAYPQGIGNVWNDSRPRALRSLNAGASADDVAFLTGLVGHLVAVGVADRSRVYLAGISNGGFMAARMACEASAPFAGFAFLVAGAPRSYRVDCNPPRPLPVLILNGTEDRLRPWEGFVPRGFPRDGEVAIMSVAEHVAFWVRRNGCTSSREERLHDREPADASVIVRTEWSGCASGGAVSFYAVEGGGHQTPSPRVGLLDQVVGALLGPRNRDLETAELLWDFFKYFKH